MLTSRDLTDIASDCAAVFRRQDNLRIASRDYETAARCLSSANQLIRIAQAEE